MISNILQKKKALNAVLLVLLMLAAMTQLNAQEPDIEIVQVGKGDSLSEHNGTRVLPIAITLSATNITANSATLNGQINTYGNGAYVFQYGKTTSYGSLSDAGGNTGYNMETVSETISGLDPGTTYHFRIRVLNNSGTSYGDDMTFTTLSTGSNSAPNPPSNPNPSSGSTGISTSRYFYWTCTDPDGDDVGYEFYLGTSSSNMTLWTSGYGTSAYISGLNEGQMYYWRIIAYDEHDASTYGPIWNFTTVSNEPPTTPSNPSPANGATGVSTSPTLSWSCSDPEGGTVGYDVFYGTSSSSLPYHVSGTGTSTFLNGLNYNQTYYWQVVAYDSQNNSSTGSIWHFTTKAGDTPVAITQAATVDGTSVTLNGKVNPQNLETTYYFQYGTTTNYGNNTISGTLPASMSTSNVSTTVTGLQANTTYHFRIYASNSAGSMCGADYTFLTGDNDCFADCSDGSCGEYGQQMYTAAQYLCERGIVEGINGNLNPDASITRAQLAKTAFYGLYSNSDGLTVPSSLVTDYFPSIYPDLQDENSYYYRAAKALLYLEYYDASAGHLDGISPFDRDRSVFNPEGYIQRCFVLKVLLETFNIAPATGGTNVFDDFGPSGYTNSSFWGYAQKAYNLNIVQTTHFRPDDYCTRGEAFLLIYRILQLIDNNTLTRPVPNYDTYNPFTSDFFIPTDLSPEVVNSMRGAEYGNFNYYNKDFFNIPGYMNLDFGIAYNSYLTEMPEDFYPVKPLGKAWTHTYDMYMNIIEDNYNNVSYLVFHLQEGSLLMYKEVNGTTEKLTEGNYYTLTKSGSSYTLKSTGQVSFTFTLKSDNVYHLTQVKDRNNNTITINYGTSGNNVRITSVSTLNRTLTFDYNSNNLLQSVTDPSGRVVRFYYTDGQLTSLKDAKNQTTTFSYGTLDFEKGLLKEITLPKGNHVYNGYQQRKLQSMSYSDGYNNQLTHTNINITPNYENGSTVSTVTENLSNSQSVTTTYTMNDKQRITNVNDGVSTNVSFVYGLDGNDSGLVTERTDNKTGLQTSYAYDSRNGMVSSFTVSNGSESHTTMVVYNDYNDIEQYTDANNNTTHYYYESSNHNLTRIVDALGHTTYFENNSHGAPTRVTNAMGFIVDYDYNSYGNLNEISIPSLNLSATIEYDNVSRMTDKYDFAGHNIHYTYDNNDNLASVTDANGKTTTYHVDANDNVDWIQNAKGIKTNFTYDANTDFMTQVEFQGHTRNYTYKRDGTLESFTDANGYTFNYTYNNAGELTSDGYADLTYYSSTGRLWKITKDSKAITYTYDDFGRISSIAYDGMTVNYTYDNNGNVTSIVYPGNKTVTYTYDVLNRVTAVKDWNNMTTNYFYRNDGQLDYYQYPNGVRTTYSYDNSGRCNGISTKRNSGNGSVIAEYSYEFDNMGNHTSETFTEPFEAYPSIPSENLSYNYNNDNRLTSVGDLSFTYDGNGNNTTRTGRTYNYDVKDNLISVSGDFAASYTYDGLGNRRSATRNGVTTKYVLNLLSNMPMVLMDTDANGTVQHYYIYGPTGLISRIDANNDTRYYVYDYRGSTVAMTDATTAANVTHKYQYDDFGKLLQSEEEDENLYRYVGRFGVSYEDQAISFMCARYYDPEIGRFLSEDPIWSTNLYPYADNNPIMLSDPQGKNPVAAFDVFAMTMGYFGTFATEADLALYGIDLDSQTGVNNYAMTWASTTASVIGMILGTANPVGAVATCLSAGISIGQLIGDKYDEQITNGMAKLIYNIKYKRKQEKQAKSVQAAIDAKQAATPKFQFDEEAYLWMHQSNDGMANTLKHLFHEISARQDLSIERKKDLFGKIFRRAHEYMQ